MKPNLHNFLKPQNILKIPISKRSGFDFDPEESLSHKKFKIGQSRSLSGPSNNVDTNLLKMKKSLSDSKLYISKKIGLDKPGRKDVRFKSDVNRRNH